MTDAGDIHLADLNEEFRRTVLVVSNERFNELSGRVIVAPAITVDAGEVPFPWRIPAGSDVFALDLARSIPADRLLERTDRATSDTVTAVRQALRNIVIS